MTLIPPHNPRPSLEVPNSNGSRRTAPNGGYAGVFPKDPRISSAHSLVPSPSEYRNSGKRRLLLVYIHGYQGTDTSFQSFPAHVHHFLKRALADTHVVHSKIYPRYKTYKAIDVARDNFSAWLEPHESPTTDVVLVGHSMGGLLNAEIVLMPSRTPYATGYFRHRILGTVNLDAPFLGLHPGIIMSGISSLFRPKQKPARESTTELDLSPGTSGIASPNSSTYSGFSALTPTVSTPSAEPRPGSQGFPFPAMTFDPNFNPAFSNDVRLQDRGWVQNVVHFVKKHHSEGLIDAVTHHFMSHLEYGSTLLDFNCLKSRYESLRKLEDIDDLKGQFPYGPRQVRFIQYYTMCYGFPKKPKPNRSERKLEAPLVVNPTYSNISTPRISVQDHSRENITNKDERKQVEKEAKQKQKAYDQAVKALEKATRDRQKIIDRREKKRLQEAEKRKKEELKLKRKGDAPAASTVSLPSGSQALATEAADAPAEPKPGPIRTMIGASVEEYRVPGGKKRKERKFCNLPSTHKVNGQLDPKWVKVFMKDTDEVGAHTGLFYPGEHYDRLVKDVVDVVVGWVREDASKRAILATRQD
ncbi:hypothetical protein DL764_009111 [Monosporascus ibericus]|uniref:DUF676 domain-containing protein n=1 Tax=Monosporascus ibericus TaxID=155417 RepID=A0A4Q4SXZ7_9PEZI|nr:hypothetical protein DL764_009111 [Monosporascus ibericus]